MQPQRSEREPPIPSNMLVIIIHYMCAQCIFMSLSVHIYTLSSLSVYSFKPVKHS